MESLRWAAEEEAKSREREMQKLREDVKTLTASRAEALQHQRSDLIETYEGLMKQREEAAHARDRDIEGMVGALESRFEGLQTESLHLKGELRDTAIKYEQTFNELKAQQDHNRMLTYRLEDGQRATLEAQESHQRRVLELTAQLDACRLQHTQELNAANQEILKVS